MPKKKSASPKTASPKRVVAKSKKPRAAIGSPLIADYMTRSPHTIGRDQTLKQARDLMNKYRIRHLPVLDGGRLVGMLSQRDMYFVESLDAASPASIRVEEAMSEEVYETPSDATLEQVTQAMIRRKVGSAVITGEGRVMGVFSTIDAMRALLQHLRR